MKTFKQFKNHSSETFIAFSNAGGQLGQYERFDYSESNLHGQGGGRVQENLDENLNPRTSPKFTHTLSPILFDPEKSMRGLGDDQHHPENIGIPDHHSNGYVNPNYTQEQAKHARLLSEHVHEDHPHYHEILDHYTSNSYNLNNELIKHYRAGTKPPEHIKSHLDVDDPEENYSDIHLHSFDKLIQAHKLPTNITVYSGLHFHPNEHRGKIAVVPSYMSASLSPHVAKDFGKEWEMHHHDEHGYKEVQVKNILRLHLPKGHSALYADNGSHFPGQGEIILPRNMRYQLGQKPTHIIQGNFANHFHGRLNGEKQIHIYTGRLLPN